MRLSLVDTFVQQDPEFNSAIMEAVEIGSGRPSVTWSPLYEKYATKAYEEAIFKAKPVEQALSDAVAELKREIGK